MKVAFLDRDGVINEEINYLHKISDFRYVDRSKKALKLLKRKGYEIIVITNQAGIAKGLFTEEEYFELSRYYRQDLYSEGVELLDVLHCPHHPSATVEKYRLACACRKPSPGLIMGAVAKYNIEIEKCILVGDKISDIEAAARAGIQDFYLVESGHKIDIEHYGKIKIFKDLYEVAESLDW